MHTFLTILIIIASLCVLFTPFFLIRNNKVCNFRITIANCAFDILTKQVHKIDIHLNKEAFLNELDFFDNVDDEITRILNLHSYDTMLWSKKPLTLENWYTEDEIAILKGDYSVLREQWNKKSAK